MGDEPDPSLQAAHGLRPAAASLHIHPFDRKRVSPKLGDFAKLKCHADELHIEHSPRSGSGRSLGSADGSPGAGTQTSTLPNPSVLSSNEPAKLGDFSRLFAQLRSPGSAIETGRQKGQPDVALNEGPTPRANVSDVAGESPALHAIGSCASGDEPCIGTFDSGSNPDVCSEFDDDIDHGPLTPSTTPLSSTDLVETLLSRSTERKEGFSSLHAATDAPKRRSNLRHVLSYHCDVRGALIPVYDKKRSRHQKSLTLSRYLGPLYAGDGLRASQHPGVTANGIHVFLDMSNINISFQHALRLRYSIPETARFTPLPTLDLQFLTEILVRGRRAVALNVGCSVVPGRPQPRYIQQLQQLGYHVDLRDRKRVADARSSHRSKPGAGASSSSDEMYAPTAPVRYVEDLVDETLQTRIAESVMEYFNEQGTLVLATGDAQPAKYSDGFFAYAERALKMGWHVEVASWKNSLSSYWKDREWTAKWADRFRIIELDDFVDELLADCT